MSVSILGIATFAVVAASGTTMTYQWQKNGTNIPGATQSIFIISNAQLGDQGNYTVKITNGGGTVTSAAVSLVVQAPPLILTQPVSQVVIQGQNTSLSVGALGTAPVTYRWSLNGVTVPGPAGAAATLTLNAVTTNNAGDYTVVVTDSLGSLTSTAATLTVLVPPTIAPAQQPQSEGVSAGQIASFTVGATGTAPFSYQWKFNGAPLSGATGSALTIANVQVAQVGSYTVVVTNLAGSVTSTAATLGLNGPPLIITQPLSEGVSHNDAASFSVSATGTAPLTYQWSINGTSVPGPAGSGTTYSIPKATSQNAGNYSVVVANSLGSVTSAVAVLTVDGPPIILSQPTNQSVLLLQSASFSVTATGVTPVTYRWYFNGSSISGATSSAYTINLATTSNAGSYKVVLTNPNGSVTSSVVALTINIPPTITAQPQSQAVAAGQPVMFTASANGTGPLGYQWNFNGAPLLGKTNSVLAITNALPSLTGLYSLMVTNSGGATTSAPAALVVTIPPVTLSTTGGLNLGMTAAGFSLKFSVPIGCTYVVLASTDLLHWTPIVTNIAVSASVAFTDSDATNYGSRYYRIMAR